MVAMSVLSCDFIDTTSLTYRVICYAKLAFSPEWFWSLKGGSEGGEHGVAVKLATGDRLLQAPIGYMAERRGSNQSWRYRIHRLKSQIEYARSGGVAYVSAGLRRWNEMPSRMKKMRSKIEVVRQSGVK